MELLFFLNPKLCAVGIEPYVARFLLCLSRGNESGAARLLVKWVERRCLAGDNWVEGEGVNGCSRLHLHTFVRGY